MEVRILDTIVNVDKPLTEKQQKFIHALTAFTELILLSDEVFITLAMLKIHYITEMIKELTYRRIEGSQQEDFF